MTFHKKNTVRESNLELMRIISIFMIIINHILDQNLIASTFGTTRLILLLIKAVIRVHVCSFVLLSGYFQSKKEMKLTKALSLNNAVWFYNVFFYIIISSFGLISLGVVEKYKIFSPISYNDYWYVSIYLILYLISPILNKVINNLDKKQFKKILFILIFCFSVLPTITGQGAYNNLNGFSLETFILLYFIGAYIRCYPIKESFIFKKCNINLFRIICVISFSFLAIFNLFGYYIGTEISSYGKFMEYLGNLIFNSTFNYDNPIILLQTLFYFLFFESLKINNNIINKVSRYVFGVYLVHENPLIKNIIYKYLGFNKSFYTHSVIIKIFTVSLIIFCVSLIIEIFRQIIFSFVYKRKICCKFRCWYQQYFKTLGLNINW